MHRDPAIWLAGPATSAIRSTDQRTSWLQPLTYPSITIPFPPCHHLSSAHRQLIWKCLHKERGGKKNKMGRPKETEDRVPGRREGKNGEHTSPIWQGKWGGREGTGKSQQVLVVRKDGTKGVYEGNWRDARSLQCMQAAKCETSSTPFHFCLKFFRKGDFNEIRRSVKHFLKLKVKEVKLMCLGCYYYYY